MPQTQISGPGNNDNNNDPLDPITTSQTHINTTGVDDILDEIDGLLETNAEDFVRSYVQKGGQ